MEHKQKVSVILVISLFLILAIIGVMFYILNKDNDELNSLNQIEEKQKYTSNLVDSQNGKTACIELESKGGLKTEEHESYYTYIDPFNNRYNIKEIVNAESEEGMMGNNNWAALFKVTVTYIDNNDETATMVLAIVLLPNNEILEKGTYDNYTGSTDFVKSFTDLYKTDM